MVTRKRERGGGTLTPLCTGARIHVISVVPGPPPNARERQMSSAGRRIASLALALVIVPVLSVRPAAAETLSAYLMPVDRPGQAVTFEQYGSWDYARLSNNT